jgi:hypothetical protein
VISLGQLDGDRLDGFPVAHVVVVGHDAGPRLELAQELGPQPQVHVGQQVQRDHGRVLDVGLEQVLLEELHAVGDALPGRVRPGFRDPVGIDVDAHAARAEPLGGRDGDPTVARPEVVEDVVLADPGDLQHLVDDALARRHVRHLGLLVERFERLRHRRGRGEGEDGGQGQRRERERPAKPHGILPSVDVHERSVGRSA